MENMQIYNAVREVPDSAKKHIGAGRLKGMTDINPMWRIQALTELFGPCGIGWKYMITEKRLEPGADGTMVAFVDIDLRIRVDGEWSDAIPGTGGASFIANERNGKYTSDECYKMALTDAISVACKALGVGADVYWQGGRTKYSGNDDGDNGQKPTLQHVDPIPDNIPICDRCGKPVKTMTKGGEIVKTADEIIKFSKETFGFQLCYACVQYRIKNGDG